jgi:hypothetical protein
VLDSVDLHLHPNEASDLAEVHEQGLLAAHDWDRTFLTVLDEGSVEDCVALLAHEAGAGLTDGWTSHRLRFSAVGDMAGRTEDAEALAVRAGKVYVVGSHYGSKTGPLQAKRHWLARFDHTELGGGLDGAEPPLQVVRTKFRLHRAVNDALRAAGIDVFQLSDTAKQALIGDTIARGEKKAKAWRQYLRYSDSPMNIEGAAFAPDGTLLLGLRFPVTAQGQPLIVGLKDVDALFEDDAAMPECTFVWTVDVGEPDLPRGIRAMDPHGDGLQVITGSLDAMGKDSVLIDHHPEGGQAPCEHWKIGPLPEGGGVVEATRVHDFGDLRSVEGVADGPEGHAVYIVDQDSHVDLRFLAHS